MDTEKVPSAPASSLPATTPTTTTTTTMQGVRLLNAGLVSEFNTETSQGPVKLLADVVTAVPTDEVALLVTAAAEHGFGLEITEVE